MTRFERDTAVRPLGDGRFEARIDRGWWVHRGPNGGYVAAILLRALAAAAEPDRAPRSLTIHYTAPPEEGEALVDTAVERRGRSLTTVTGRMSQGGRLLAIATAAFSTPRQARRFDLAQMPEVEPPEACEPFDSVIPIHDRYECRWAVGPRPASGADVALSGGWIRAAEPQPLDAPLVAAFTDAWPPSCFALAHERGEFGPVPTVDLTVHFRRELPAASIAPGDFVLARFHTKLAEEGFVEEDGEIWSRDGLLLAQSRQLGVLLTS